ncbi:HNH endonuclease [Streptomyces catenulae]|uniref:HNH endonuclease n=1 Tax=Streptomyces catenulae TaxID=66875 RepID=A0ABV2Z1B6_9ACTN|nr:HNH endonuclease [Streptomyces catenulae]
MAVVQGYPNIHHATASAVLPQIQLSKGINPIAKVKADGRLRRPAILIRSSPLKAGSAETPWHDVFDLDNGRIRYFGDHRATHTEPVGRTQGNAVLLQAVQDHRSDDEEGRAAAAPLLVFTSVARNGTHKGYVRFCGVAVIETVEKVMAEDGGRPWPNYCYDLSLLDLSAEDDRLDWTWIESRGTPGMSTRDTLAYAPHSWQRWVEEGHTALHRVRHRPSRPTVGEGLPGSGSEPESTASVPEPRQSGGSRPAAPGPPGVLEELTSDLLIERLRTLKVHQNNGRPSRHKPLAVLWGISKVAAGEPPRAPWPRFREEVGGLMAEFGAPGSSVTPEYPFWHLRTSRLWEVNGVPPEHTAAIRAATFDRFGAEAGLSEQAERLLGDDVVRSEAIAVLRETFLDDVDQDALLARLELSGYTTASGTVPDEESTGSAGPAARRTDVTSRVVRDPALVRTVKNLHHDRCQFCDLQLRTRTGTYSQAAHIRGLGQPHNGPDVLSNLLVLCPNDHVRFDTLALYVDADDVVRETADGTRAGVLRRHEKHRIDAAYLRYHRALCGRESGRGAEEGDTASA